MTQILPSGGKKFPLLGFFKIKRAENLTPRRLFIQAVIRLYNIGNFFHDNLLLYFLQRGNTPDKPVIAALGTKGKSVIDTTVISDIATIVASLATGGGAIGALIAYRRSLRTRRAEWLCALHQQFFESEKYERIRSILDYEREPSYSELRNAIQSDSYHDLVPDFWRYLNFFEFIASLYLFGEISKREIAGLFEYDIRLLSSHDFIVNAVQSDDAKFYQLPLLLREGGKFID